VYTIQTTYLELIPILVYTVFFMIKTLIPNFFFVLLVSSFFHVHVATRPMSLLQPNNYLINTLNTVYIVLQLAYSVFLLKFFCQSHRPLRKFSSIVTRGHAHISFRSFVPFLARPGSLLACYINY